MTLVTESTQIHLVDPEHVGSVQSPAAFEPMSPSHDLRWLLVMRDGLGHVPYCLEAKSAGRTTGVLPLAYVRSAFFGRFLVSLPYLNSVGVRAEDESTASALLARAVALADELDVRHLELRHEIEHPHVACSHTLTTKVHMRLSLPDTTDELWNRLKAKVRNQVRKGAQQGFELAWGGTELMTQFYEVFSRNMRDLGTPAFGRRLFESILGHFSSEAELCVVRMGADPVAAALLVHGNGITEVPSASSLKSHNSTNANMFMYWQLLCRAVERGQKQFDFGRSTMDSGTYAFKKQWGAEPFPAVWQYYVRKGNLAEMRPDHKRFQAAIRIWRRLPLVVTRLVGPAIVRGIP